jgi:hypothetical protein
MSRQPVNVFYYPETTASSLTLKKTILFFDEIHFMDRPSFTFDNFGSIGMASPLRAYEQSFRENGIPLFVHQPNDGPVWGEFLKQVEADINDDRFLKSFQQGLKNSETFRNIQISRGNYGAVGNETDVARHLVDVDLDLLFSEHGLPSEIMRDKSIPYFAFNTPLEAFKNLIVSAAMCSTKMNFALNLSAPQAFTPLADAAPYADLLGAKYSRTMRSNASINTKISITDLSFAIFDELITSDHFDEMTFGEIVDFRKRSESARIEFLEHLSVLQVKQGKIGADGDYKGTVTQLVQTEILPAVRTFRKKLNAIHESLFGNLAKGALGALAAAGAGLSFFGDISWTGLATVVAPAAAYVGKAAIDAKIAERSAMRECAISYVLSLKD